eukprot:XP_001693954.1 predicted protein [Chlamydomonas reinhardtii]
MPSSRRKGIVRADAAEHYKQAGFTDKEAEMMIKVLPCTNDLVKKSDLDLHSAKLSAKIDLRSTELSAKLDLRSAELSSKMDLLNVKMEKVLIVVLASGLLLASPEGLAGNAGAVCGELLKEAMTALEYGHTYCYDCIEARVEIGGNHNVCPVPGCGAVLGPSPFDHHRLVYDSLLDGLVAKIFPRPALDAALSKRRMEREAAV